jgi:hypothetical protein
LYIEEASMSMFSASISPPEGTTVQDFVSANTPVVQLRPGYRRSARVFCHDTVWVVAASAAAAAAELQERLGPSGTIHRAPAPLLAPVSS